MRAQLRFGAGKVSQWVKELATKTYSLSLIPVAFMPEEKKELLPASRPFASTHE